MARQVPRRRGGTEIRAEARARAQDQARTFARRGFAQHPPVRMADVRLAGGGGGDDGERFLQTRRARRRLAGGGAHRGLHARRLRRLYFRRGLSAAEMGALRDCRVLWLSAAALHSVLRLYRAAAGAVPERGAIRAAGLGALLRLLARGAGAFRQRQALTAALNARNHLLRLPFSRQEDFTMNKEQIREHMEVLGSDGKHHLIPLDWVDHVDNSVHLKKTSQEAIVGWRTAS